MSSTKAKRRLKENVRVFSEASAKAKEALMRSDLNGAVAWAKIAAHFAFIRHPGFYVDAELEGTLLDVAEQIKHQPPEVSAEFFLQNKSANRGKMRFLHVVTETYDTGGHSCFMDRWVQNTLDTSVHSLIATAQTDELPGALGETLAASGGWYMALPDLSPDLAEQALLLRLLSQNWADVVVLFTHPFDPLPTVAYGVAGGPPVVFVNHADHAFWLGASVADLVVDYHQAASELNHKRRGIMQSKLLPIPLTKPDVQIHRQDAREELGFTENEVVLLTVGRPEKYLPHRGVDFLDVLRGFLNKHPKCHLLAVGPTYTPQWQQAHEASNGKIAALGEIDRTLLEKCYAAADVYVPSFPSVSATSMLEAALHELPIVGLHMEDLPHLSLSDDLGFCALEVHKRTVEDFLAALDSTVEYLPLSKRKAQFVQLNIEAEHCTPGWSRHLNAILQALPAEHRIRRIKPPEETAGDADSYWEMVSAKMLGDELPWHSYNRLIRTYQRHLTRTDALNTQARSLMSAFVKSGNFKRSRQFLRSFGEFVDSAFERDVDA